MNLWGGMILRAGITWGVIGVVLAILGGALGPLLPEVDGLTLGTYALLMAGVHYGVRANADIIQSMAGGALSAFLAAVLLYFVRFLPTVTLPTPPGTPADIISAVIVGVIAGAAGGLGAELIDL